MTSKEIPPTSDQGQRLALTYREAAASLGVCERSIWSLVRDGSLPAVRIGRSVRIPVSELEKFVAAAVLSDAEREASS